MGTWGAGLFSDDTAADVRDDYRSLLGEGLDDAAATRQVLDRYLGADEDDGADHVVWLALAATQSRAGRLDSVVRDEALRVIDDGLDLAAWAEASHAMRRRRRASLAKLRDRLTGPQPARRRIAPEYRYVCDLEPGDVLRCRRPSGPYALLVVVTSGADVCLEVLDWGGTVVPDPRVIGWLPSVLDEVEPWAPDLPDWLPVQLFVMKHTPHEADWRDAGHEVVARIRPERPSVQSGSLGVTWKHLGHTVDHVMAG